MQKDITAMYRWIICIQLVLLPLVALALETPVPERFLAPRHFNPHPITDVRRPAAAYKRLRIPEPADVYAQYVQHRAPAYKGQEYLQYAPAASQEQFGEKQQASDQQFAIQKHQYASTRNHQHAHHAYAQETHAQHTAHVQHTTSQDAHVQHNSHDSHVQHNSQDAHAHNNYVSTSEHHRTDSYDEHIPKQYAFSYSVLDHHSGDDFSHNQQHDGHSTEGQYRVKLPDGRTQVVKYTADKGGYRAKVTYEPSEVAAIVKTAIVHPPPSHYKQRNHYSNDHQYSNNHHYSNEHHYTNEHHYPSGSEHHYVSSTTYPSVEYKKVTKVPSRVFYKHPDLTVHATKFPTVQQEHHYPSESEHHYVSSTTYPSVEYKTVTEVPPRVFYKHPDLTVATTFPTVHQEHHYGGNEPNVQVDYNGGAESSIEASHQVYEQHHIYKRGN